MTLSQRRQVVVTGCGALCPAGVGLQPLLSWWRNPGSQTHVPDFDPARFIHNPRQLRTMQRLFQLSASAALLALAGAGLADPAALASSVALERAGTAVAIGDISPVTADLLEVLRAVPVENGAPDWARFGEIGVHQLHPFRRLTLLANMAAAHVSLLLGLRGPSCTFTSGSTAGEQAVTEAAALIAGGWADFMVVEAADSPDHAFSSSTVKEAAGALVLEEQESAARRGAPVLAVCEPCSGTAGFSGELPGELPVAGSLLAVVAWLAALDIRPVAEPLALPGLFLRPGRETAAGGQV